MVKNNELSLGDRLRRGIAIGTLGVLGATGLAACGPSASAEKGPENTTPVATASATPGASETTTSAPAETSTSPEAGSTSPELQALAASVTPEKLITMSPEEIKKAFTINVKDLDPKDRTTSYAERFAVLEEARERAGMSQGDIKANNGADDLDAYFTYATDKYLKPATEGLMGSYGGDADFHNSLVQTYWQIQGANKVEGYAVGDYNLSVTLDKSKIDVKDPMLNDTDPFTLTIGLKYKETFDAKKLQEAIGGDRQPYDTTNYLTITGVTVGPDGSLHPSLVTAQTS